MYFKDVDLTGIKNPLKYYCAPNAATYNYVPAHDLVSFIKAMFYHCYVSPEDTRLDYNNEIICLVREDFLSCLEMTLLTTTPDDIPIWKAYIYKEIDFDMPTGGVWVAPEGSDFDLEAINIIWEFGGTEPSSYDEELDVLRFDFCWDDHDIVESFWLGDDAVKNLEYIEIKHIIAEARKINYNERG